MSSDIANKFRELYSLNVNDYVEQKNDLSYLSWSFAWAEFKKVYPDATYTVAKDEHGKCYFGDENIGYMVYTTVSAGGLTYEMWLPVMDGANMSMKLHEYSYTVKNKSFKYATLNVDDGKYYDKYGNEQTEFITKKVDAISMFDINKTVMRCLVKNLAMFGLGLYIYAGEDLPEDINLYVCAECGTEIKPIKVKGEIRKPKEVLDACGGVCTACYKKKREENKNDEHSNT